MTKIGLFPNLEVLILYDEAFTGDEWNTFYEPEQIFPSLRVLRIYRCPLKYWNADDTYFPRLERLVLENMDELEEIPLDIGNIPTLQSIHVKNSSQGVFHSAKEIQEQQQSFGNDTIQIHISDDESEDGSDDESKEYNTSDDESEDGSEEESGGHDNESEDESDDESEEDNDYSHDESQDNSGTL